MNFFSVIKNSNGQPELVTCDLDGTVLPGVTRASIIETTKEWGMNVVERQLSMTEFIKLHKEKRVVEVFASGTAATVCPIGEINYKGESHFFLEKGKVVGDFTSKLLTYFNDIYYGRVKHRFQRKF